MGGLKAAQRQLEIEIVEFLAEQLRDARRRIALDQIIADEMNDTDERGDVVAHGIAPRWTKRHRAYLEGRAVPRKSRNFFRDSFTSAAGPVILTKTLPSGCSMIAPSNA